VTAETVNERWLAVSWSAQQAGSYCGWPADVFERAAASRSVVPGRLGRFSIGDVTRLAEDPELARQVRRAARWDPAQAGEFLGVRRWGLAALEQAGFIVPCDAAPRAADARRDPATRRFLAADVEELSNHPGIDWAALSEANHSDPSLLRHLHALPRPRAATVRRFADRVAVAFEVDAWALFDTRQERWSVGWSRGASGGPGAHEVDRLLKDDEAGVYGVAIALDTPADITVRWARSMLEPGAACVVHCEASDRLTHGIAIEVAVLDAATGEPLMDTLVDSRTGTANDEAWRAAYGITGSPSQPGAPWPHLWEKLADLAARRVMLVWNRDHQLGLIERTCDAWGGVYGPTGDIRGYDQDRWECLRRAQQTWRRTDIDGWLPATGRALDDAHAGLQVLRAVAAGPVAL
jgi:DNA polymerase-3 subunit epsilon